MDALDRLAFALYGRAAKAGWDGRRDTAMESVGVVAGDVVEYHAIPTSILGTPEYFRCTVYLTKNGRPRVALVGGGWKPWHKGWKKVGT